MSLPYYNNPDEKSVKIDRVEEVKALCADSDGTWYNYSNLMDGFPPFYGYDKPAVHMTYSDSGESYVMAVNNFIDHVYTMEFKLEGEELVTLELGKSASVSDYNNMSKFIKGYNYAKQREDK